MELIANYFFSLGWVIVAVLGYFFIAIVAVFDKYLLHSRISKPAVYAFYVAIFSLFALFFVPFGFSFPGLRLVFYAILSGFFYVYGLVALYKAVSENEVSRVSPLVVGTVIPLVSVVFAYIFLGERLGLVGILSVMVLTLGGFLISFDLPINSLKLFRGFKYSLLSGVLQALSLAILKGVFNGTDFLNGFIWNRIGFFLAGISLLGIPIFRKQIKASFAFGKKSKKTVASTGLLFVLNKIMAGTGSFLIVFAISIGSVSAVNATGSIQFVFVLMIASFLSIRHKEIFQEKLALNDWIQKAFSILLIAFGLWMLSNASVKFFYLTS